MLKVGLTGGIGSGKTYVAGMFEKLGIPVYDADSRAKHLMMTEAVRKQVIHLFGEQAYNGNELNRKFIAGLVFNDKEKLEALNAIVHPAVRKDYKKWHSQQNASYTIREAAILFESGSYVDCDFIITVTAPEAMRINRVMTRDGISKEEVIRRMKNQWTDEGKIERSDSVIDNDVGADVQSQIKEIDQKIRRMEVPK